jgi:hypothetical protein
VIITNAVKLQKAINNPAFHSMKKFQPNLVAVQFDRSRLKLDKPIVIGFTTLEDSKIVMYKMHYKVKEKWGSKAELLFTDTDSLCYQIKTKDLYQDMAGAEMSDLFDTSDYPRDHPLYSAKNKKVLEKFKDETNGVPITEFVGLRAKMYSFLTLDQEKKTAKGISRSAIKNQLTFQKYKDALEQCKADKIRMMRFQSDYHQVFSIMQNKTGLSPADNKRYILNDGKTTRAYGHKDNGVVDTTLDADLNEEPMEVDENQPVGDNSGWNDSQIVNLDLNNWDNWDEIDMLGLGNQVGGAGVGNHATDFDFDNLFGDF